MTQNVTFVSKNDSYFELVYQRLDVYKINTVLTQNGSTKAQWISTQGSRVSSDHKNQWDSKVSNVAASLCYESWLFNVIGCRVTTRTNELQKNNDNSVYIQTWLN